MGQINEIAYQQGLGDWKLLLYYENGIDILRKWYRR